MLKLLLHFVIYSVINSGFVSTRESVGEIFKPFEESATPREAEETSNFYDDEGSLDDLYTADGVATYKHSDDSSGHYTNCFCENNSLPLKTNKIVLTYHDEYDTDKPKKSFEESIEPVRYDDTKVANNPTFEETDAEVHGVENADDRDNNDRENVKDIVNVSGYNCDKIDSSVKNETVGNNEIYTKELDGNIVEGRPIDLKKNRVKLNVANNDYSELSSLPPHKDSVEKTRTRRKNVNTYQIMSHEPSEDATAEENSNLSSTQKIETQNINLNAYNITDKNCSAVTENKSNSYNDKSNRSADSNALDSGNSSVDPNGGLRTHMTKMCINSNSGDETEPCKLLHKPEKHPDVTDQSSASTPQSMATNELEHEVRGKLAAQPNTSAIQTSKVNTADDAKIAGRINDFVRDLLARASSTGGMKKELGLCKTYDTQYTPVNSVNVEDAIMKGVIDCVSKIVTGTVKSQSCGEMPPELMEFLEWLLLDGVCARDELKQFMSGCRNDEKALVSQKDRKWYMNGHPFVNHALGNGTSINSLYKTIKNTIMGGRAAHSISPLYPFFDDRSFANGNANPPLQSLYGSAESDFYNGKHDSPSIYSGHYQNPNRYDQAIDDDGVDWLKRKRDPEDACETRPYEKGRCSSRSKDFGFPKYVKDPIIWYNRGVSLLDNGHQTQLGDYRSLNKKSEPQVNSFDFN